MISRSLSDVTVGSVIERKGTQGEVGKVDRDHLFRLMSRATLSKSSQQRTRSCWAHAIPPPPPPFSLTDIDFGAISSSVEDCDVRQAFDINHF